MVEVNIPVEELEQIREDLNAIIHRSVTDDERHFFLSFKDRNPKWELLGLENLDGVSNLPSVQWKLVNITNMNKRNTKKLWTN